MLLITRCSLETGCIWSYIWSKVLWAWKHKIVCRRLNSRSGWRKLSSSFYTASYWVSAPSDVEIWAWLVCSFSAIFIQRLVCGVLEWKEGWTEWWWCLNSPSVGEMLSDVACCWGVSKDVLPVGCIRELFFIRKFSKVKIFSKSKFSEKYSKSKNSPSVGEMLSGVACCVGVCRKTCVIQWAALESFFLSENFLR